MRPCRSLALSFALASLAVAQAPTPPPAPIPAPAPRPAAKAAAKPAAKPGAKPAPQGGAALKPEVTAQSKVRGQVLKQKRKAQKPYRGPKTDLNGATKEDLAMLPGVTPALADRMIAGRPYLTKAHLITRDVLPYAVYLGIKDRIVAVQPPKTR